MCSLPVWVTDDVAAAKNFVGSMLKDYAALPSYRAMLDIEGVQGIESISLIGSERQVADGLARIADILAHIGDERTVLLGRLTHIARLSSV